jgi:hypothetical protein
MSTGIRESDFQNAPTDTLLGIQPDHQHAKTTQVLYDSNNINNASVHSLVSLVDITLSTYEEVNDGHSATMHFCK